MRTFQKLIIVAALAAPFSVLAIDTAHAEACVPSPAVEAVPAVTEAGWQRYSWTGGPVEGDVAPAFPGEGWQPNVAGDPHKVGKAGAYFRSHGGSGKGDWFYLEATVVVVTPEIPGKDAVVCPDPEPTVIPTPDPTPTTPTTGPDDSDPEYTGPEITGPEGLGGGEQVIQPLPHTGLSDRQIVFGATGLALIIAGGVAVYASRQQ